MNSDEALRQQSTDLLYPRKPFGYVVRYKGDPDFYSYQFWADLDNAEQDMRDKSAYANQQDGGWHTEPAYEVLPIYF